LDQLEYSLGCRSCVLSLGNSAAASNIRMTMNGVTNTNKVLKILIAGGAQVGKTALLRNFNGLEFQTAYTPTVNSDFSVKNVSVQNAALIGGNGQQQPSQGGDNICVQLWDIGATSSMGKSFFRNTNGVVFVIDCCGGQSSLPNMRAHVQQSLQTLTDIYERVHTLASCAEPPFPGLIAVHNLDMIEKSQDKEQVLDQINSWAKAARKSTGLIDYHAF
jgi:GTPase SAR1 family protein